MFVLGIDGGGTKTTGIISDQSGRVIAQDTVGPTNLNSMATQIAAKELKQLFQSLESQNVQAFHRVKVIFAGMSGVDNPEGQRKMRGLLKEMTNNAEIINIDNDAVNALYSGTLGHPGVVHISGTGSIAYGLNDKGEHERVGGWGYLIGDPGSGFAIGRAALEKIFASYDGYGEKTELTRLLLEKENVNSPIELISSIYELGQARRRIAPLSQLVTQAADMGDKVAQTILSDAAGDMATAIKYLIKKLFNRQEEGLGLREKIPVVLTGGVYRRADLFIPTIKESLSELAIKTELVVPDVPPVAGALMAAWKSIGKEPDQDFILGLKKSGLTV